MKKIIDYAKKVAKEATAQIFTALGFFLSWFLLTGSAKDVGGVMILISFALWFATINFRK